jgi:hypothetical protein
MKYRFIFKPKRLPGMRVKIHSPALITGDKISFKFNILYGMSGDSGAQISGIPHKTGLSAQTGRKKAYSAATSASLAWADERMKSEIRGTISDLKREPLNTP